MSVMKVSAWSGIIFGILFVLIGIVNTILNIVMEWGIVLKIISVSGYFLGTIFSILFLFGFFVLSRRTGHVFLAVISVISMVFALFVGLFLILAFFNAFSMVPDFDTNKTGFYLFVAYSVIIIIGIMSILTMLVGAGLIRIGEKVPLAKATGILNVIAGATYFILVGFLVRFAAFILQIIILFKASNEFKNPKKVEKKVIKKPEIKKQEKIVKKDKVKTGDSKEKVKSQFIPG